MAKAKLWPRYFGKQLMFSCIHSFTVSFGIVKARANGDEYRKA